MNDTEVEIEVQDAPSMSMDIPGMGGGMGMIDLSDMMGKALGKNQRQAPQDESSRCVGQAG